MGGRVSCVWMDKDGSLAESARFYGCSFCKMGTNSFGTGFSL